MHILDHDHFYKFFKQKLQFFACRAHCFCLDTLIFLYILSHSSEYFDYYVCAFIKVIYPYVWSENCIFFSADRSHLCACSILIHFVAWILPNTYTVIVIVVLVCNWKSIINCDQIAIFFLLFFSLCIHRFLNQFTKS